MLKILNFLQEKLKTEATLVLINVKKVLGRLRRAPIFQFFKNFKIESHWTSLISTDHLKIPSPNSCRSCSSFQAKSVLKMVTNFKILF